MTQPNTVLYNLEQYRHTTADEKKCARDNIAALGSQDLYGISRDSHCYTYRLEKHNASDDYLGFVPRVSNDVEAYEQHPDDYIHYYRIDQFEPDPDRCIYFDELRSDIFPDAYKSQWLCPMIYQAMAGDTLRLFFGFAFSSNLRRYMRYASNTTDLFFKSKVGTGSWTKTSTVTYPWPDTDETNLFTLLDMQSVLAQTDDVDAYAYLPGFAVNRKVLYSDEPNSLRQLTIHIWSEVGMFTKYNVPHNMVHFDVTCTKGKNESI